MSSDRDKQRISEPIGSTQFLLLLQSVPQIGEKALLRLLAGSAQRRLTAEAVLDMSREALQAQLELDPRAAAYLVENREELLQKSAEAARTLRMFPLELISCSGAGFPMRLERWADVPPPLVYALGNRSLLNINHQSASGAPPRWFTYTIAASRKASAASLKQLDELSTDLAAAGGVPVTGHDRPEYQRLALAAQRKNLPAIYVFDRGLREALGPRFDRAPFAAARIRDTAFVLDRDLALSPYRLDDHGLGANNRRRDSIIFALSDLVVALDVRPEGAMFEESLRAHEQGKPVFCVGAAREGGTLLQQRGVPLLPPISALTEIVRSFQTSL